MIKIYQYKINKNTKNEVKELLSFLPNEEQQKAEKYKFEKDYLRYAVGKILTRNIISAFFAINPREISFSIDEYSRPFLNIPKIKNFDFNLSHSGDFVVVAISNNRIGIDVEKIKKIDLSIANNVFHDNEIKYINKDKNNILQNFYKIWTLKEAFIKAIGQGLSYPLKNFYFNFDEKNKIKMNIIKNYNKQNWYFKTYDIDDFHKTAVCTVCPECPREVCVVSKLSN